LRFGGEFRRQLYCDLLVNCCCQLYSLLRPPAFIAVVVVICCRQLYCGCGGELLPPTLLRLGG
jgi:hypothetical protein